MAQKIVSSKLPGTVSLQQIDNTQSEKSYKKKSIFMYLHFQFFCYILQNLQLFSVETNYNKMIGTSITRQEAGQR